MFYQSSKHVPSGLFSLALISSLLFFSSYASIQDLKGVIVASNHHFVLKTTHDPPRHRLSALNTYELESAQQCYDHYAQCYCCGAKDGHNCQDYCYSCSNYYIDCTRYQCDWEHSSKNCSSQCSNSTAPIAVTVVVTNTQTNSNSNSNSNSNNNNNNLQQNQTSLANASMNGNVVGNGTTPPPTPPSNATRTVTLIVQNTCPGTVLLGTENINGVQPQEGRLDLESGQNLTFNIVIPVNQTINAGRLYARTGCRFNRTLNKAQCEVGDCANQYDCSSLPFISGTPPVSLFEFNINAPNNDSTLPRLDSYDVSLIDGYSNSLNALPINPVPRPPSQNESFWCKTNLCREGLDLKANCPANFAVFNTQLKSFNNGTDTQRIIACYNNCGRYSIGIPPGTGLNTNCDLNTRDCFNYARFCGTFSAGGEPCMNDMDCLLDYGCLFTTNSSRGVCRQRPYYRNPPCDNATCTNQGPPTNPPAGNCSLPDCIGDDNVHRVCPRVYSFATDAQNYNCFAPSYLINLCPGGSPVATSPSGPIPLCTSLAPQNYDLLQINNCNPSDGSLLCARQRTQTPSNRWGCGFDRAGVVCDGVLCRRE